MSVTLRGESEYSTNKSKRKIFLWAILWAVFPPILLFVLLAAIIKPALKGKEPSGINYILWILGLSLLSAIFQLPFGSFDTIAAALKKPEVCQAILFAEGLTTIIGLILVILTFRNKIPNSYVPMKKFTLDGPIIGLWILSLLPLLTLLSSESPFHDPGNIVHPFLAALAGSLKNKSYFAVAVGILSIGFFGPVLEEIIFRGMLVEASHESSRSKGIRYLLDSLACLYFALLHVPVSFIVPLILAVAFIYVRRRSGSLWPSILMHASWNTSILVTLLVAR
jgi:membrane protease YdiL (CAAX protease family)